LTTLGGLFPFPRHSGGKYDSRSKPPPGFFSNLLEDKILLDGFVDDGPVMEIRQLNDFFPCDQMSQKTA